MALKDKIFRFGIYGKEVKNLSKKELTELLNKPWVELLTPDQISKFKESFTMSRIGSIPSKINIPENYIIRMNMHAWRAYLMGPDFITNNKHYFVVVDYLLETNDYVPCSLLRSKFNIDPKTMHYICKKLLEKNIITTTATGKKDNKEIYIRICDIKEKESDQAQESKFLGDFEPINTSNLVFYNNLFFIEQLAIHIKESKNGIGTKELNETVGIKLKIGLKFLQIICEMYPDEFKMINSIEHGHTTFKVFSIDNLKRRNREKLENMKHNSAVEDPLLSSTDRQEVLKMLIQKYGHFPIKKEIIDEISQITGYPYQIDRKNILQNAQKAGLKIFLLPEKARYRYILADSKYDESILKQYIPDKSEKEDKFSMSLKKYFLEIERCVIADNGYCTDAVITSQFLYSFLKEYIENVKRSIQSVTDGWIDFDYETVMQMPVRVFFRITKVKRLNFLAKCTFEIYNLRQDYFNRKGYMIDSLFEGDTEPYKLNSAVFTLIEDIRDMKMNEFTDLVSSTHKEILREVSKPHKYLKKLQKLATEELIDLEIDGENRIRFRLRNSNNMTEEDLSKLSAFSPVVLKYNSRVDFIHAMKNTTEETFEDVAEDALPRIFSRSEQKIMNKYINLFLKEYGKTSKIQNTRRRSVSLKEPQQGLYFILKKAILFQTPIDFRILEGYENVDVEDVLEYMIKKDIVSGFRSLNSLTKTYLNKRFEAFLGDNTPAKSEVLVNDDEYFFAIKPKIYSIVEDSGSIDFDQLVSKSRFFEPFEIERLLEIFDFDFQVREIGGFRFISLKNISDPFE